MPLPSKSVLSAATVVYFSEIPMLNGLIASMERAAGELFAASGMATCMYLIDNSDDVEYFSLLEAMRAEVSCSKAFQLELTCSPGNLGYGGGNNLVRNQLNSCYHLVINPDVIVWPDALCQAVAYFEQRCDVAIVSPMVIEEDGSCHHVIKVYPDCFTLMLRYLGNSVLNRRFSCRLSRYQCDHLTDQVDKSVELAGGCFQFMRTELFQRLGGFDDRFFMYFEDYDLSIRARESGAIAYVPAVKISHLGGGVGRKTFLHHRFFVASAIKFFIKHGLRLW
ncbi:MAG: glycosyltransferase [Candidatus Endonucleobacter bathymodioli]|uniref:Glycosyltransferase n=1 Tax=Candidatus Endonucleibacter bathymodioli TaxID=539814 RepID=A0AA90SYZ0_9GAMM|nr:glycosyltransferase [Candidatus Endonucleobacter bathymodioli]